MGSEIMNPMAMEVPVDKDNEGHILANAIKDSENRKLFARKCDITQFRHGEFKAIAWALKEISDTNLQADPDMILLKSKASPYRYNIDFNFINELMTSFPVVSKENFETHLTKLSIDSIKSSIAKSAMEGLYQACLNPKTDLGYLQERISYLNTIIEKGFTASVCGFETMADIIPKYLAAKDDKTSFRTTGFRQLDDKLTEGYGGGKITIVAGLPGMGKCLMLNTPIIMYSGEVKKVQDVKVGDLLMGPDSKPRKVLSLSKGRGQMYKVKQNRGDDYTVNANHILSLRIKKTANGKEFFTDEINNINVVDFMNKCKETPYYQRKNVGYKIGVDFKEQTIPLEPYFVGLFLGDGTQGKTSITTPDEEIKSYLKNFAPRVGLHYTEYAKPGTTAVSCNIVGTPKHPNPVLDSLRDLGICNTRMIPAIYKFNSRENRLQLLAGLIDSDGYITSKCCEILTKYDTLKDDILFLARSLGFQCNVAKEKKGIKELNFEADYWRININGDLYTVPTKVKRKTVTEPRLINKDLLSTRITVEDAGIDDYYGFEVDGDHLYLLGDFTVTHNSSYTLSSMKNLSHKKIWTAQFALEMDSMSITSKLLAFNSGLPITRITKHYHQLNDIDKKLVEFELERLRTNEYLYFNDKPRVKLKDIREQIMILQDRIQQQYIVVPIDLFGKIGDFAAADNFAATYERKLNDTQVLARDLGVHLILVAQINRGAVNRNTKFSRPKMSDLKNSGAFEEIADLILAIHRPYYDPEKALKSKIAYGDDSKTVADDMLEDDPNRNLAEVIILKQRMGAGNDLVNFYFDPDTTKFGPIDPNQQMLINASKTDMFGDD